MPAADDTYSIESGATLWGGRPAPFPAWRTAQTAQTWVEVPVSAALSTLNPALDPALNPNYPTQPEYMSSITTSFRGHFAAWCGGAWDEARQRWSNVRTGGHADNASNEQFFLNLLTPNWERLLKPSGWDGSVITNDQPRFQAGSSGNTVILASGSNAPLLHTGARDEASAVDDAYNGMTLAAFGQTNRTITDYVGATRTATVSPAYSGSVENLTYVITSGGIMQHGAAGELSGRYSDGRMRAVHNYNRIVYAPLDDSYIVPVIGLTSWLSAFGTFEGCRIDATTGAETFFDAPPSPLTGYSPSSSGSCVDPTRGSKGTVWWFGSNGSRFGKLDVATLTWSLAENIGAQSGAVSLCYLPGHDCILMGFTGVGFKVFDCATETLHTPTFSGTAAGSVNDFGQAQPVYVAADGRVYWWNNPSGSTVAINYMTVPTNPRTDAWAIAQTTADGSNAITPSARQPNGTYGRFWYSAQLDGFGLTNETEGPVYFYARANL